MKKKFFLSKKISYPVVLLAATLLNAVLGIIFICLSPDRVAVHFNAAFEADKLGSPWMYLPAFVLPPFAAVGLIFENVRKGQKPQNRKPLKIILTFIAVLIGYIGWLMLVWCGKLSELGQKAEAPLYILVCVPMGTMFIFLGNYLPVIKRNGTLGIKTPTTLASDYVWAQTHRVMGKVWVVMGIGEILAALADTFAKTEFISFGWLAAAIVGECILLPFVTSHFKKREIELLLQEEPPRENL